MQNRIVPSNVVFPLPEAPMSADIFAGSKAAETFLRRSIFTLLSLLETTEYVSSCKKDSLTPDFS